MGNEASSESANTYVLNEANATKAKGVEYYKAGEYDEALSAFRKALDLYEKKLSPHSPLVDVIKCHNNIASVLRQKEEFDEAMTEYRAALEICEGMKGGGEEEGGGKEEEDVNLLIAKLHTNMGAVLLKQDRYEEAVKEHQEALSIHETAKNTKGLAASHGDLGNVYLKKGDESSLEEALKEYRTAEELFQEVDPSSPGLAKIEHNIQYIQSSQKRKQ